jgi:hypothetical protein
MGKGTAKGAAPPPPPPPPPEEPKETLKGITPVVVKEVPKGVPTIVVEEAPAAPSPATQPVKEELKSTLTAETLSKQMQNVLGRGSTEGLVRVDPQYAAQNRDRVVEINGQFYRASIPSQQAAFMSLEERKALEAQLLNQIRKGEVAFAGEKGWTRDKVLREAMKILGPYTKRQGDDLIFDIVSISLSDDAKVQKAAQEIFPDLDIKGMRQSFEDFEAYLKENYPDIYKVYSGNREAGLKLYDSQVKKEQADFASYLAKNYPDIYQIYRQDESRGIDAYNALVAKMQRITEAIDIDKYHPLAEGVYMQPFGAPPVRSKDYDITTLIADVQLKRIKVDGKPITRDDLKLIFGNQSIDDAWKVYLATTPRITTAGAPPVVTQEEFAHLIAPASVTEAQIKAMTPYVLTGERGNEIDIIGALKAKVPVSTVAAFCGITDKEDLADLEWQAKYEQANWAEKQYMAVSKAMKEDPWGTIETIGLSMIPIVGTMLYYKAAKEEGGGLSGGEIAQLALFGACDLALFIPVVSAVSAEIKGGLALARAGEEVSLAERALVGVGRGAYLSAKATILSPITMATHPVEAVKTMLRPWEVFTSPGRLPVASSWRGSYSATMDMEKVLAGEGKEALATRAAMAEVQRLMQAGKASGEVPIIIDGAEIGSLKFSGTGLQGVLRQITAEGQPIEVTLTSTPYGPEFTGKGVKVGETGKEQTLFTSTETPLGFAFQSATGKMPLYIYRGDKLLGMLTIDEAGRLVAVDESGVKLGAVAEGAVVRDLRNGKLGIWRDGQIYKDWNAIEPIKAKPSPSGLVVTEDPALIGQYYAGQKEYNQATNTMLTINKEGMLVDDAGKVVSQAKAKAVGYFPEGTDISSLKTGQTIGQIKAQPTFVMIYNNGVQELPMWAAKANTIEEMEKRAWQLFESDKYSGDLYEGFKKYAIFMENEGVLPKDTAIIPVLDDKGKPVILWTRSPSGKKIAVPVMQLASKDWLEKSLELTRELSGKPSGIMADWNSPLGFERSGQGRRDRRTHIRGRNSHRKSARRNRWQEGYI